MMPIELLGHIEVEAKEWEPGEGDWYIRIGFIKQRGSPFYFPIPIKQIDDFVAEIAEAVKECR